MREPESPSVVLIVDDVQDIRMTYRLLLEADSFGVLEAESAAAALECLRKQKVDVLLTDLYMPGTVDGIGLIETVRKMPRPHPAIIAMSGEPNRAYRSSLQVARYLGADATLTKPVSRDDLVSTIRRFALRG